ncbi:MAG: efflux RND transporter periplasmic adaptor subunit [Bacteroidota bacterium]
MKRARWIWISLVLLAVVALGGWYTWSRKQAARAAATGAMYKETTVVRGDISQTISASGTVEYSDQVNVHPLVSGKVKTLCVKVGDRVQKGQLLLTLDETEARANLEKARKALAAARSTLAKARLNRQIAPAQLQAQVESARASVRSAEAELKTLKTGTKQEEIDKQRAAVNQAKINRDSAEAAYKRAKDLYGAGALSRQDFESAEATYLTAVEAQRSAERELDLLTAPPDADELAAAEARVSEAKASLRLAEASLATANLNDEVASAESDLADKEAALSEAQQDLASTRVVAPISGIVIELSLKYNSTTSDLKVGDTISPETGLIAIANPSSAEVSVSVDEADVAGVRVGQSVVVTADAFDGKEFEGRVTSIAPAGTTTDNVVTFTVTVSGPALATLKAGMTADADIIVARRQQVLIVPREAIVERRGRTMVRVAAIGDGQFKRVEVGLEDETNVEILSGLSPGDTVLVSTDNGYDSKDNGGNSGGSNRSQGGGGPMGFGPPPPM